MGGQVEAFAGSTPNPAEAPIPATLLVMEPTDTDSDGLPDGWEQMFADGTTDLEPGADDDADGASDREEWLAGTHPRDAALVFVIGVLSASCEGEIGVSWQSAGERAYRLATATLAAGPYTNVFTGIAAAPPTNTVGSMPVLPGAAFIRVVLEEP